MDCRKFGLTLFCCFAFVTLKAQQPDYQTTDSTAERLYNAGNWKQLIQAENESLKNGIDFPALRLRLGYAQFVLENYGAALYQYDQVLKNDAFNQTARFYKSLCYKYLNHDLLAAGEAAYLDTSSTKLFTLKPFGIIDASLESSYKIADDNYRGNASYTRFGLNSILFKKLQLEQSVAYFGQYIYIIDDKNWAQNNDQQTEYFAKLSYALANRLVLFGGWHYMYTAFQSNTYNSNVLLAGLNYTGNYIDLQGDVDIGNVVGDHINQYNAKITVRPLGNLNLYFISQETYLLENNNGAEIFNQTIGFKALKNLWLESSATFGKLDDYIEGDGLYIYNAVDDTKLKLGQTIYYQLNAHAMLQLNYIFEKKQDIGQSINYNQYSITAGLLWRF